MSQPMATTVDIDAKAHGNMERSASVIPWPARRIGVSPMRGLMISAVNGATGDWPLNGLVCSSLEDSIASMREI